MGRNKGFTLIELLVVMAIIAILSAIIFPVFMRARISAKRSADISNMNTLRTALQLYRTDQGAYPPALLGYVTLYDSGASAGNVIPADQLRNSPLYPKRVDSIATFKPSNNRATMTDTAPAQWPNQDERAVGAAPILDLDGNGTIEPGTGNDDPAEARQAYGPTSYYTSVPPYATTNAADAAVFYRVSGYEMAEVKSDTGPRFELRYSLFWTNWGVGNGVSQGNAKDDPRQLGYSEPPESTVVTWNSYFRDYTDNTVQRNKNEIVLFLGGSARPYDSADVANRSWRVLP